MASEIKKNKKGEKKYKRVFAWESGIVCVYFFPLILSALSQKVSYKNSKPYNTQPVVCVFVPNGEKKKKNGSRKDRAEKKNSHIPKIIC